MSHVGGESVGLRYGKKSLVKLRASADQDFKIWLLRRRKKYLLQSVVGQLKLIRPYLVEILLMTKSMLLGYANGTSARWDRVIY